MIKTIETDRLVLRAMTEADDEALLSLLMNSRIKETYMIPDFPDADAALKMARRYEALSQEPDRFVLGIAKDGAVIGLINEVDKTADTIEIGYAFRPDCWNRGYATEALKAVIPALLADGWQTVTAGYFEENAASRRVMEKAGMTRTDRSETVTWRGKEHRCIYYACGPGSEGGKR